jgi:glycosyltransferase involved in cell wall biosynthesis
MPAFFPVLEAWAVGCPVLTSDLRGIREPCADAALLVDPRSVESIAEGIRRLWTDASLRATLAERGRKRSAAYTPEDYRRRLLEILEEAKRRVRAQQEEAGHGGRTR